jgi:hypothetical protein
MLGGGNEYEARQADIRFYIEQSVLHKTPTVMPQAYLNDGWVRPDPSDPNNFIIDYKQLEADSLGKLNNGKPSNDSGNKLNLDLRKGGVGMPWDFNQAR